MMSSESRSEVGTAGDRDARQPTSGPTADKVILRGAPKDPTTCYFFDNFSGASLERRNWETAAGAALTRELLDRGQSVAAVRLGVDEGGAARQPELRSAAVELAGVPGAELSYTVQHHGVEAGERLAIEYLSADGRWHTIERVVAARHDSVGFSRHLRVLPEDALHAAFRVRFRPDVDDGNDAWYLGEVAVVGYEPLHTLGVRVRPARQARVEVVPVAALERLDGTAPFTRLFAVGTQVYLVAPPAVDGWVFSHWAVDGALQVDRQRMLVLEISGETQAVAHYQPWVPGRSEASVAIVSLPEPGVPIRLGPEPERLYTDVAAEIEFSCLTGEWLALLAPPRTERLVFAGWVVNGQALQSGENLLEYRVTGDDVLLAEYVLLGDMNGDGALDKFDVDEFLVALINPEVYAERHPDLNRVRRGDINGDGSFDRRDVEDFVDLLLSD